MSKARDLANAGTALGAVTATELAYVDGVTSAIQTQIDSKIGSASAINPTIVDAKGDIIAASAADTPARLAVGNTGETLVADSSTTTGLRYAENYAAGKNKIINGDFGVWQRGTSFSISTYGYTADRWQSDATLAYPTSRTVSQQSFTPGTAPVAGYEGSFFLRTVYTYAPGNPGLYISQKIEDVRTFAGQTVTVSFWAKVGSAASLDNATILQNFGSGGSTSVQTTVGAASATTSWQRFSFTVSIPSIAGKTIGTDSNLELRIFMPNASSTTDIWGVQVEESSVATAFQTATGTIQGELAACQRYYFQPATTATYPFYSVGAARSTTVVDFCQNLPVPMRVVPTSVSSGNLGILANGVGATALTNLVIDTPSCTNVVVALQATVASGLTQFRFYYLSNNNNSAGYLGLSAEL